MSASIARSTFIISCAKRAVTKPYLAVRAYGTSWAPSREEHAPDDDRPFHDSTLSGYEYSSFESTLERVLEMAKLGKEPQEAIFLDQAVRSAYKRRGIGGPIAYI